jgi:hypothetical protein
MPELTAIQVRILRALAKITQWATRKDIGAEIRKTNKSLKATKGFSEALGSPTSTTGIRPNSLEARRYVERNDPDDLRGPFEYKITAKGRTELNNL